MKEGTNKGTNKQTNKRNEATNKGRNQVTTNSADDRPTANASINAAPPDRSHTARSLARAPRCGAARKRNHRHHEIFANHFGHRTNRPSVGVASHREGTSNKQTNKQTNEGTNKPPNERRNERTKALSIKGKANERTACARLRRPSVRPSVRPHRELHHTTHHSPLCHTTIRTLHVASTNTTTVVHRQSVQQQRQQRQQRRRTTTNNNNNNERRRRKDDVWTTYPDLALHCATATSRAHLRICVHHSRPLQASIKQHRHLRLLRFVSWLVARWVCRPTLRCLPSARVVVRCPLAWLGTCKRS